MHLFEIFLLYFISSLLSIILYSIIFKLLLTGSFFISYSILSYCPKKLFNISYFICIRLIFDVIYGIYLILMMNILVIILSLNYPFSKYYNIDNSYIFKHIRTTDESINKIEKLYKQKLNDLKEYRLKN